MSGERNPETDSQDAPIPNDRPYVQDMVIADMLDAMGYDTGIDLTRLLAVARQMPDIVGHAVPGQVAKAGRITDLHPAPAGVAELRAAFTAGATAS